jgi:Uma2 family endonuclease
MSSSKTKFSLQEFLDLPESGDRSELMDGEIVPKVSPKYKHSTLQLRLLLALNQWCESSGSGRVRPEWAIVLKRQEQDWVPVPDLTYVSYEKLPVEWEEDEPCPALAELVVEIISPCLSFGEMTSKVTDYLLAGISRVWVVDNQAQSITVFGASEFPQTFWINDTISDALLPELAITLTDIFTPRRLSNAE